MDNGGYTTNNQDDLVESYKTIKDIFAPYQFMLQQFCTNSSEAQQKIDRENDSETPQKVKFFGMHWDMTMDTLSPYKIELNMQANTKRKILSSINGVYDVYNIYAPTLLRARLFVQQLQADPDITWDSALSSERLREWSNITKQANATPAIAIPRSMGPRTGVFRLVAFTDASIQAYGAIIYLQDLENNTVTYLTARNRLTSSNNTRTMPSLELQALVMGTELVIDTFKSLSGETVVSPVNIIELEVYTDSMVCLQWIERYSIQFDKLQKVTIFVKNKLRMINRLCNQKSVTFYHVSGCDNPSDFLTRPCGYKLLFNSCYFSGPKFLLDSDAAKPDVSITLPNPVCREVDEVPDEIVGKTTESTSFSASTETAIVEKKPEPNHLIPLNKYSKLSFHISVLTNVLKFINAIKLKIRRKRPDCKYACLDNDRLRCAASNSLISTEQRILYPEVYAYLEGSNRLLKDIPDMCNKYNLYIDENDLLRIKSKLPKGHLNNPIILSKNSLLSMLLIRETHDKMCHAGLYVVLKELRQNYHITSFFSAVKNVLKQCIVCRKIHENPIQINQNSYREFRSDPPKKPFSYVFMDYIGPFTVKLGGTRQKVYLLAFTCLWSRAVNLKVCRNADVAGFLEAVQLHCFEYGIFEYCVSDLGSQIQSGANIISSFLSDFDSIKYLEENGIKKVTFQHYSKGNSSLGSLIESLVKQVKYLIKKSIGSIVLDYFEFHFLIVKVVHLVNKRPISFKDGLRSLDPDQVPTIITPELLLKGYETVSVNVIPPLQQVEEEYIPGGNDCVRDVYGKLRKVRENLIDFYHSEFLATLITQAVDKKERYKPVQHRPLKPGDIVLLADKFSKRYNYPMGRVSSVESNTLGEVTSAYIIKGVSREKVYRHVTSLIFLLPSEYTTASDVDNSIPNLDTACPQRRQQPLRKAATACRKRLENLQQQGSV